MSLQDGDQTPVSEVSSSLENSMKELLEKILTYMEKFIKTKEDLSEIETKLNDYDNLVTLMDIIKNIFGHLQLKVDEHIDKLSSGLGMSDEYEQLEKIVQKHESEIRTHIRLEQQLKLYAESLQSKFEESEKNRTDLLESTKHLINDVKRDNQNLSEELQKAREEREIQTKRIAQLEEAEKMYQEKLQSVPYLQEKIYTLEKQVQEGLVASHNARTSQSYHQHSISKDSSYKKVNVEFDIRKKQKSETPPVGNFINSASPNKLDVSQQQQQRRAPTPTILNSSVNTNDYLKVKIEIGEKNKPKEIRNSFQRFYNQVKNAQEQSMRTTNKDIRTIYSQGPAPTQNKSAMRDRDVRTIGSGGASIQSNSHNNSFVQTSSSSKGFVAHKRSKSHGGSKIRGLLSQSKHPTDYSRVSNQEFQDVHLGGIANSMNIVNIGNAATLLSSGGYGSSHVQSKQVALTSIQNSQSSLHQ